MIRACAAPMPARPQTWLNEELIGLYVELHRRGHAHSVETWQEGELVGGLYGLALGGAFFGESMFSRVTDASKIALVDLVDRLRARRLRPAGHPVRHRPPAALRRRRDQPRRPTGPGCAGRWPSPCRLPARRLPVGRRRPGAAGAGGAAGGSGSGSTGSAQSTTQTS